VEQLIWSLYNGSAGGGMRRARTHSHLIFLIKITKQLGHWGITPQAPDFL
jgi:hypothetical protein